MKSKILVMMICSFIFFLLNVAPSLQVRFSVIGQDLPLVIPPGEDAVLPCHLSPQVNAENMTIRWFKDKYQDLVHLYQDREDRLENQMAEYSSRTTLIKDGIITGSVSLIIHNVRPSDSGLYTCFYHSESFYEEAVVELNVAALGSKPHIYLEDFQNGGITVVCESSGWYPEPDALWKDEDGNNISSSTEVKARDGSLQFHVKATYIFSGHPSTLFCCIRNPLLSEWKQSTVHITDAFFHRLSSCMLSRLLISASFTLLGILLISWTLFLLNEQRKLSEELGKLSEELGKLSEEHEKPSEEEENDLILFTVDDKDVCRSGFPPASYEDNYKARAVALGRLSGLSHVVFSPDCKMYAVIGSEIYVGPMPSNPSKNWLTDTAKCVGKTGWEEIKCLFFHPNGTLFAVTQEGAFYKGPPPTNKNVSWLYAQATKIGAGGWNGFDALFFDPKGILHAVTEGKFVKNSPPTTPNENWLEGCQTIGKCGWSMLSRFMSFSPDGKLWCVLKLGGIMFAASPPPDERDNWIGRAERLGHGYLYKFMAFTRDRTIKSFLTFDFQPEVGKILSMVPEVVAEQVYDNRRSTSPLNSVFTLNKTMVVESSFSHEHGFTIGLDAEMTFKTGVPIIEEGGVKVAISASTTHNWSFTEVNRTETQYSRSQTVQVAPGKAVRLKAVLQKADIQIPYRAKGLTVLDHEVIVKGTWEGSAYFNLSFVQEDIE